MSIMTRFVRLFKADMHGVMDQIEDRHLILSQSLREMEESLDQKSRRLKRMSAALSEGRAESERTEAEMRMLDADLDAAIRKDRDDIARFLIRKRKGLKSHAESIGRHLRTLDAESRDLAETLERQRQEYEQIRLKAADLSRTRPDAAWEGAATAPAAGTGLSEEEIELELLRRKEILKGGTP